MQGEQATKETQEDHSRLMDNKVGDLTAEKRRLVEVPYTATLAHTMNTLVANNVAAVPVAAPPGHWIGAGGSMIMEADKQTGVVRKHYIGMVTMLDILAHIAGDDDRGRSDGGGGLSGLEQKMSTQVSSIIGHCLEGLSLWTLNPSTSLVDCMEVFSKGIHRSLVPIDSHMDNVSGVELAESASGYKMFTQMDLLRFLMGRFSELNDIVSLSVGDLGAVNESVYAITDRTKMIDAIKCMRIALLNAVPIVQASNVNEVDHKQLINGRHRKVIGTFSATDLRGCHLTSLQTWLPLTALEFTEKIPTMALLSSITVETQSRDPVTCRVDTPIAEVIEKAVTKHVHRVWVVDGLGQLLGLVSLTDIIRALRAALVSGTEQM